jgi:predicted kinase
MSTIKIMCGLPRSGKSTWIERNRNNEVIISADQLRYAVYNQRFWDGGEKLMWGIRDVMLKYFLDQGVDIIVDETNVSKWSRKPIIELAKKAGYVIIGYLLDYAMHECIERAEAGGDKELLTPVIERMDKQFEPPTLDEGFDKIYVIEGKT